MTDYIDRLIKKHILAILMALQDGEGIKRFALWQNVYSSINFLPLNDISCRLLDDIFTDVEKNDTALRKRISELKESGYCIGSSIDRGYFMIRNQADYVEAIQTYRAKIFGMWNAVKRIKENAERSIAGQISIPFTVVIDNYVSWQDDKHEKLTCQT